MNGAYPVAAEVSDLLSELVNIGVGRAAASLSDLIGARIELTVPALRFVPSGAHAEIPHVESDDGLTIVVQQFNGEIDGRSALVFPHTSAMALAALLSGVEDVVSELDIELNGVLMEVGNIVLNGVMGTLANEAATPLGYSLPTLYDGPGAFTRAISREGSPDDDLLIVDVRFQVQQRAIEGSIVIVFTCGSVKHLVQRVDPAVAVAS